MESYSIVRVFVLVESGHEKYKEYEKCEEYEEYEKYEKYEEFLGITSTGINCSAPASSSMEPASKWTVLNKEGGGRNEGGGGSTSTPEICGKDPENCHFSLGHPLSTRRSPPTDISYSETQRAHQD